MAFESRGSPSFGPATAFKSPGWPDWTIAMALESHGSPEPGPAIAFKSQGWPNWTIAMARQDTAPSSSSSTPAPCSNRQRAPMGKARLRDP